VALGSGALGFVFAPSTRQVAASRVYDIIRRLPPEVLTVGVFRNEAPKRVVEVAHKLGLRAVQLHGHETAEQTEWVKARVPVVIKAFGASSPALQRPDGLRRHPADAVLVDAPEPGSGETWDWHAAAGLADALDGRRLILAGGLQPDNVVAGIEAVHPWGVDVSSGVEAAPGRKDPARLRRFIANAKSTDDREDVLGP
ncbi:MAG: phosphoribosylanthranilate isomerase, partial [Acidimicrobiia bacterium]|nr:phosphoribosylanthranilate isomerase [Acidimicrobiia bacterium]